MKAVLTNYRQAPRKVRLVAGAIRGKSVAQATTDLSYLVKRAALPMKKLIESAIANAIAQGGKKEDLFIQEVRVDKGTVIKRFMPRAFGRASRIHKHSSHVTIVLGERDHTMATKTKKQSKKTKVESPKKVAKKAK